MDGAVIIRDHRHIMSHVVSCLWWNEYKVYPPRDQTSLAFAGRIAGLKPTLHPDGFEEVRTEGRTQSRKLWYNYVTDITQGVLHVGKSGVHGLLIASKLKLECHVVNGNHNFHPPSPPASDSSPVSPRLLYAADRT